MGAVKKQRKMPNNESFAAQKHILISKLRSIHRRQVKKKKIERENLTSNLQIDTSILFLFLVVRIKKMTSTAHTPFHPSTQ